MAQKSREERIPAASAAHLPAEKPIGLLGNFWTGVVSTLKEEHSREGAEKCCRVLRTALRA